MKKILIILFCLISLTIISGVCHDIIQVSEYVNSQHPLMIGDVIYETKLAVNDGSYGYYNLKLRFIGIDSSQVKIRYEFSKDVPDIDGGASDDIATIIMPLDEEERTYIRIHQLPRLPKDLIIPAKTLMVNVYNRDKNLIVVEEFGKYKSFKDKEDEIEK